ncbi:MAG: MscL family protein [Candidatus Peribacteria bacterium]|jgi:large conductance mechanosensitive channel protein|nr:MscL family protein [Candidatus Peribacteria bacterium]
MEPIALTGVLTGAIEHVVETTNLWQEFLYFIETYNIFGVAVGLLIATKVADFTKSMVEDLVTPLFFKPLFKKLKIEKLEDLSYKGVLYGKVLARCIDFLITAFFIFLLVKYMHISLKK